MKNALGVIIFIAIIVAVSAASFWLDDDGLTAEDCFGAWGDRYEDCDAAGYYD